MGQTYGNEAVENSVNKVGSEFVFVGEDYGNEEQMSECDQKECTGRHLAHYIEDIPSE